MNQRKKTFTEFITIMNNVSARPFIENKKINLLLLFRPNYVDQSSSDSEPSGF